MSIISYLETAMTIDINEVGDKYLRLMEEELGDEHIPMLIVMICKMMFKQELDIHWVLSAIISGYNNVTAPQETIEGQIKYDS